MECTGIKTTSPVLAKSEGGKKVGLGCQARIDQAVGCENKCVGCYAKRVTRCGDRFDVVMERVFDEAALRDSIKGILKEGIDIARCGSVCDPGHNPELLLKIINVATEEGLRLVVTTKSLVYRADIARALKAGNHLLQVSLGMISEAQSEKDRVSMLKAYRKAGVDVMYRITTDVTIEPNLLHKRIISGDVSVLVTPLRVIGRGQAAEYNLNIDSYGYHKGYYRPLFVHESWGKVPICGEVDGKIKCANCLVPTCTSTKNLKEEVA